MFNPEQLVEIIVASTQKKRLESLGYSNVKIGEKLTIKAKDLSHSSSYSIEANCDICNKQVQVKYVNYNQNVDRCGMFRCQSCVSTHTARNGKRYSKSREDNYKQFIDLCERNNYIPLSTIDDFDTRTTTIFKFICPIHGEKTISTQNIKKAVYGCKECFKINLSKKKAADINHIISSIESNGNKLLNPEEYINAYTKNLRVLCGNCGEEFLTSYVVHYSSPIGFCGSCGHKIYGEQMKLTPERLEQLYNSEEKVLLNPDEYITNSATNLIFVCKQCGDTYTTSKSRYDRGQTRCRQCSYSISIGEDKVIEFLSKNNITFVPEKRYSDCRDVYPLPFDFYLPDYNLIIEFDGQQHFLPTYGEEHFEMTKRHDKMKNEYCQKNNIPLIRIPYYRGDQVEKLLNRVLFENNIKMRPMCMVKQ